MVLYEPFPDQRLAPVCGQTAVVASVDRRWIFGRCLWVDSKFDHQQLTRRRFPNGFCCRESPERQALIGGLVRTENLNPNVMVMKAAEDRV